jgi:hypothetical protein
VVQVYLISQLDEGWKNFRKTVKIRAECERNIKEYPVDSCDKGYEQLEEQLKFLKDIEKANRQYLFLLLDHFRETMVLMEDGEWEPDENRISPEMGEKNALLAIGHDDDTD